MWIALAGIILAVVALVYAWRLQQELSTVTRRLDRYNRALFDANDEVRRLREEMTTALARLRVEVKQATGTMRFTPEMTIQEAQLLHPQTQQVLASFHLGGCSSCAVDPSDTLMKVCAEHGIDVNTVIDNLNLLIPTGGQGNGTSAQPVKIPNMKLEL